jgi:putative transcriptional regulator
MTHPSDEHLIEYAAGTLPRGMALLVACHLTYCPRCRADAADLEMIAGAMLGALDPHPVLDATPVMARLDRGGRGMASTAGAAPARADDPILPRPLHRALGGTGAVRWRRLLPGLADHRLEGDPGEDVRLVRARPGARIMAHTHEGDEATLVLAGCIRDGAAEFGPGDVSLSGPEDDHSPQSVGRQDCVCLMVLGGRMRFTGRFGRILNVIT